MAMAKTITSVKAISRVKKTNFFLEGFLESKKCL